MRVTVRDATPDDYGFIVHTTRKELADQVSSGARQVLACAIDAALRGGHARVAALENEPDALVGHALYGADRKTLLFVYVSHAVRGNGIAARLKEGRS